MTFKELQDEVLILVDPEDSEMEARIPSAINDAVLYVANEPGIVLPTLKSVQTVTTVVDQSYATLPVHDPDGYALFDGKVIFAQVDGTEVSCHNTLEDLMVAYPSMDEIGDVEAVAIEGQTVWYVKQPDTETSIIMLLYKFPTVLEDDEDEPNEIPRHLHMDTIVRRSAMLLFDKIEQGEDGQKTNTLVQQNFYNEGIDKLKQYLGKKRRGMSRSVWNI